MPTDSELRIAKATPTDVGVVLALIKDLAAYEQMSEAVVATEADIHRSLFSTPCYAEALIARVGGDAVGFALFFHTYSTWRGRRGLHLEDLYVTPEKRQLGAGGALLSALAQLALERDCARLEWWVLNWNEPAIRFYESLGAKRQTEWTTWRLSGVPLEALAKARGDRP